ncbi:FAD-dependent oxidoreductase [Dactylosporangium sp. NPDC005572]|uniref:NAD(P)/FAD-dependent oxidoreductase n=1 Tax=Dactylosporangium sp. NPDC005572 TaxID=3156889 RepID=UPI0033B4E9CF
MGGLVIVGAALAGLRAVEAARRAGYEGPITLLGAEKHVPYDRPPLSKAYLTDGAPVDYYREERAIREGLDVDLRLGVTAEGLDTTVKTVRTDAGEVPYDRLIIATGAFPRVLPGIPDLDGIVTLRTADDAELLRSRIAEGAHVVVLGAGFVGSEIASSARHLGAHVTIAEAAEAPLVRALGPVVGAALAQLHPRNGTRLLLATRITEYLGTDRIQSVRLSTGETVAADLVVIGIGAAPATAWLAGSGVELHPDDGGVVCDEQLRTSAPDVFAAGDVVHWPNAALGRTMRLENWTNAADQGARAGVNAAVPARAQAHTTVPYFWSDWYGKRIQFVGTAEAEAVEFVSGGPKDDRFVALFRSGDHLVGAATLDEPRRIMKLRRLIADGASYTAGVDFVTAAAAV